MKVLKVFKRALETCWWDNIVSSFIFSRLSIDIVGKIQKKLVRRTLRQEFFSIPPEFESIAGEFLTATRLGRILKSIIADYEQLVKTLHHFHIFSPCSARHKNKTLLIIKHLQRELDFYTFQKKSEKRQISIHRRFVTEIGRKI